MKVTHIKQKLEELDHPVDNLRLGDFDAIGELTAKKARSPESELYKKVGCFYRPNYERGLLIYSLIRKHKVQTYLEIGFGRGYSAFCAAKAMNDEGIRGNITSVYPFFDKNHIHNLARIFPQEWFDKIDFVNKKSEVALSEIDGKFDMIYVDGDHTYEAVKKDWELCKDKWNKVLLFDDYHMPTKAEDKNIEVARVIDQIEGYDKELILMDRRIFLDDRGLSDEEIDYGQVILTKK
jgi:predicted O-methyltransferase YrrM